MRRRQILTSIAYGLTGWMIPTVLRFTGATPVPKWSTMMFTIDVCAVLSLGIIITYLIFTRPK